MTTKKVDRIPFESKNAKNVDPIHGYDASKGLFVGGVSEATHKFWSKQPVASPDMLANTKLEDAGIILEQTVDDISKTPLTLPQGYTWDTIDLNDDASMDAVYELLKENYVEDTDGSFRFLYSKEFMKWALCVPGMVRDWHLVVKVEKTGALMGFISAVPIRMKVHLKEVDAAEINFLCVSKKLRGKRLTPVIVAEVTRRVRLRGVFHAVYTAGIDVPGALTVNQYYHRMISVKKAVDIRFTAIPRGCTFERYEKLLRPPRELPEGDWRRAEVKDGPVILELLNKHFERRGVGAAHKGNRYTEDGLLVRSVPGDEAVDEMKYHPLYSLEEIEHYVIKAHESVVRCYVRKVDGKVMDFCSYYCLPSQVLKNWNGHELFDAAFIYYNAGELSSEDRIEALTYFAAQDGKDVLNGLVMQNQPVDLLTKLKFGSGDGHLRHYAYNWRGPKLTESDIGLILC